MPENIDVPTSNITGIITNNGSNEIKPTEQLISELGGRKISKVEKEALKIVIKRHLAMLNVNPTAKKNLVRSFKKELPDLTESQILSVYKEAEKEFYATTDRFTAEELINKLNIRAEYLMDNLLEKTPITIKDAAMQATAAVKIDTHIAKVNKLVDAAPNIEINFNQDIPEDKLLRGEI